MPSALQYYPDDRPGISRRKHGRGFRYIAPDGTSVDQAEERRRINALAVPPAYENVWITPLREGHLQATGRDMRKRKQYRYHPDWANERAARKFAGLAAFGAALPRLRARIARDLNREAGEEALAVAATLALIDRASLRVGDPVYTRMNGSVGATTLEQEHVEVDGARIALDYPAKGGKQVKKTLNGKGLSRALERLHDLPGGELATWVDASGAARSVRSEQINAIITDICGEGATAKTFRTWNGTHAAFMAALKADDASIKALCEAAAERLHNTPTICRGSYIHPAVIALSEDATPAQGLKDDGPDGLRKGEAALIRLLEAQ